jgi:hypothetical protein
MLSLAYAFLLDKQDDMHEAISKYEECEKDYGDLLDSLFNPEQMQNIHLNVNGFEDITQFSKNIGKCIKREYNAIVDSLRTLFSLSLPYSPIHVYIDLLRRAYSSCMR